MSDGPLGDGWWEASDGKWYAPELHPDHRQPATPPPPEWSQQPDRPRSIPEDNPLHEGFEPPRFDDRIDSIPPPARLRPPAAGRLYPPVEPSKRSTGKILAFIFGGIFLLMAGGCGVFIWSFRDEIADATIDFSDAVEVDDRATCSVTGVDFGDDYAIDATLRAVTAEADSHYRVEFEVLDGAGTVVGSDDVVFRSMSPDEERTEDVFNVISASEPAESVTCNVTRVLRAGAGG